MAAAILVLVSPLKGQSEVARASAGISAHFTQDPAAATATLKSAEDSVTTQVDVLLKEGQSPAEVVKGLRAKGLGVSEGPANTTSLVVAVGSPEQFELLLQQPGIVFVEEHFEPHVQTVIGTKNMDAQDTHQVQQLRGRWDVDGTGVKAGVWDGGGVLTQHMEFTKRAVQKDAPLALNVHATHVTGTIAAAGLHLRAQGMAPKVGIECHDWYGDLVEMKQAATRKVVCTNHSYGYPRGWQRNDNAQRWEWLGNPSQSQEEDYLYGKYGGVAMKMDSLVLTTPELCVFVAAGNERGAYSNDPSQDPLFNGTHFVPSTGQFSQTKRPSDLADGGGYDTLEGHGLAKNVITIGAIEDITEEPLKPHMVRVTVFSSWGPPDDGRVKPDLVANGAQLYSPTVKYLQGVAQKDQYTTLSGTSMATPAACGIGALLSQHAMKKLKRPLFADEMKALLIHTAMSPHAGPTYTLGWGSIRADLAGDLLAGEGSTLRRGKVQTQKPPFVLNGRAKTGKPLRVTLVWLDPEGLPNAGGLDDLTPALVNDLDLALTSPAGKQYHPWALNPKQPAAAATRSAPNHVDNVERVDVSADDVQEGEWTVQISPTAIQGEQPFSLAISGLEVLAP